MACVRKIIFSSDFEKTLDFEFALKFNKTKELIILPNQLPNTSFPTFILSLAILQTDKMVQWLEEWSKFPRNSRLLLSSFLSLDSREWLRQFFRFLLHLFRLLYLELNGYSCFSFQAKWGLLFHLWIKVIFPLMA